jgi:hypothetical protein
LLWQKLARKTGRIYSAPMQKYLSLLTEVILK